MSIPPLSETELMTLIKAGETLLAAKELRLWELIRIQPARWSGGEYGEETGGFWAVGVFGNQVLWYNEIEEGFNLSRFTAYGEIDELWCNQDELNWVIARLMRFVDEGKPETTLNRGRARDIT